MVSLSDIIYIPRITATFDRCEKSIQLSVYMFMGICTCVLMYGVVCVCMCIDVLSVYDCVIICEHQCEYCVFNWSVVGNWNENKLYTMIIISVLYN